MMKILLILFVITFSSLNGQFFPNNLPKVIINEIHITDFENDDFYIELLVTDKSTYHKYINEKEHEIQLSDNREIDIAHFIEFFEIYASWKSGDLIVIHSSNSSFTDLDKSDKRLNFPNDISDIYRYSKEGNKIFIPDSLKYHNSKSLKLNNYIKFIELSDKIVIRIEDQYMQEVEFTGQLNYSLSNIKDLSEYLELSPTPGYPNNAMNKNEINKLKEKDDRDFSITDFSKPGLNGGQLKYVIYSDSIKDNFINHKVHTSYGLSLDKIHYMNQIHDVPCGNHTISLEFDDGHQKKHNVFIREFIEVERVKCAGPFDFKSFICPNIDNTKFLFISNKDTTYYSSIDAIHSIELENDSYFQIKLLDSLNNDRGKYEFKINVVEHNEDCDDNNPCTINDKYDSDCICRGVKYKPNINYGKFENCLDSLSRVEIKDEFFDSYKFKSIYWNRESKSVNNISNYINSATGIGLIKFIGYKRIKLNDCHIEETHRLINFKKNNLLLPAVTNIFLDSTFESLSSEEQIEFEILNTESITSWDMFTDYSPTSSLYNIIPDSIIYMKGIKNKCQFDAYGFIYNNEVLFDKIEKEFNELGYTKIKLNNKPQIVENINSIEYLNETSADKIIISVDSLESIFLNEYIFELLGKTRYNRILKEYNLQENEILNNVKMRQKISDYYYIPIITNLNEFLTHSDEKRIGTMLVIRNPYNNSWFLFPYFRI